MLLSIVLKKGMWETSNHLLETYVGTEIITKKTLFSEWAVIAQFLYRIPLGSCVRNRKAPWHTFNWLFLLLWNCNWSIKLNMGFSLSSDWFLSLQIQAPSLILRMGLSLSTLLFFVLNFFYCLLIIAGQFDQKENKVWKRLNVACKENISLYLMDQVPLSPEGIDFLQHGEFFKSCCLLPSNRPALATKGGLSNSV